MRITRHSNAGNHCFHASCSRKADIISTGLVKVAAANDLSRSCEIKAAGAQKIRGAVADGGEPEREAGWYDVRGGLPGHRVAGLFAFASRFFQGAFRFHELPIKIPARKTSAPPSATWNNADAHGVSMNRWRIHEMMPSSTSTTHTATAVAVLMLAIR
jgi:hypothetical protein